MSDQHRNHRKLPPQLVELSEDDLAALCGAALAVQTMLAHAGMPGDSVTNCKQRIL